MEEFDYEEVVKATENFNPKRMIGKGSHGMVYKGVLTLKDKKRLLVAVKKPSKGLESLHDNSKLENEIRVLSSLCESRRVVNLLGTTTSTSTTHKHKLIVMELMPNGSLHDLLHAKKTPPTWPKRVEIAMQIAGALEFLHQGKPPVIHRDIKSSNILFDSHWNAKLADFGLAVKGGLDPVTQPAGTIGYLDPSYTTPDKLSTKNDIFSFGVVLLEIISARKAIDVCKTPASLVQWATQLTDLKQICDTRMPLPAYMVRSITHLLRCAARCVSQNEDERPSAGELVIGMELNCFVERVRFPVWTFCILVWFRKRTRKLIITPTRIRSIPQQEGVRVRVRVAPLSSGNKLSITIKEVLADVSFD